MQIRKTVTIGTFVITLILLLAANSTLAGPQTRLTADNPNPPASPVKLIFIHHSTGGNWLADPNQDQPYGGLGTALMSNNYFVSATNYGWGPDGIGDRTDIPNWPEWFTGPNSSEILTALYAESGQNFGGFGSWPRLSPDPGGENEIVMFKSCFPNSDLWGNPDDPPGSEPNDQLTVSNAKAVYNNILTYFATRQDKLFIVITAPPLMVSETAPERAANARAFNNWLRNDWLDGYPYNNVAVFDYYNVLTSNGSASRVDDPATNEEPNDAGWADGNHHRWWNGAERHTKDIDNNYSAYPSGDSHPTTAGHQKATAEFVQLLNVFYHRWKGDEGTPTPTATGPPSTATPTATATATGTVPPSTATPTPTPTATQPAGQQTMTFQDGVSPNASYAGTTDVILANDAESNANLGGAENLETFFGEAEHRRSLVHWDLSALPGDAAISSATVELYRYDGYAENAMQIVLYRVTRDWAEGTGWDFWPDPGYVPDGATWTLAGPGTAWTTPGGDFDATVVGQITLPAGMANGWVSLDATAAVRAWIEQGLPNYGLLLRPQSGDYTYHYYYSRNHTVPNLRPRLVVNYTVGVATVTPTATSAPPTSTPTRTPTTTGAPHTSTPTRIPTPTGTGTPPAYRFIYLPLILKNWAAPLPTPTPTATTVIPAGLIQPTDLVYQGAFAYPSGEKWAYSGHALAYYPEGDPESADGYPGSLYAAGHAHNDLVGEISIPAPVASDDFDDLPAATVLQPLTDITGGWKDNCTYNDDCIYREVDGLEYLPHAAHGGNKIVWNLRDWYNTAGYDQDSLGWSDLDMSGAQGVWHIGERGNDVFHNAKTCNYLFKAPETFASQYLEGKWLLAGNHREAGALGGSQGPTLYALAPWQDGHPPASGQTLDALALLYYPEIYECVWEAEGDINEHPDPGVCHFPVYRAMDNWGGGAWVQTATRTGVLIFGRKGLGDNCYGSAAVCGGDACAPSSGYHAYPYEPQMLFYDPGELKEVLAGTREPWQVLPYAVYTVEEVLDQECAVLGAAAYDRERGLIYVTEQEAGPWGETVVHVWRVEG